MTMKNLFITAIRALKRNKGRSVLTSIGIIIGVSSIIVMIGAGNSATEAVLDKINNFGENTIKVRSKTHRINDRDLTNILNDIPNILYATPLDNYSRELIKNGFNYEYAMVNGCNSDMFKIKKWEVIRGDIFTPLQASSTENIAVIGYTIKNKLFGARNPINQNITIKNVPFKVVGVLAEMGQELSGKDFDSIVIVPYHSSLIRLSGKKDFDEIYITTTSAETLEPTKELLINYFRKRNGIRAGQADDFSVTSSKEQLSIAEYISSTLTKLLAGIAAISLVIGGIGVMNIMLVSVSERTREIGIRMAIGAKKRIVLAQFLVEAITLCSFGGAAGIFLGLGIYGLLVFFLEWPFILSVTSIVLAFSFSAIIGIFFGFYPATKAAKLKPVEALRYE